MLNWLHAAGGTGEYLAPEGLKTLHIGQTEVTWSMLPWTKHMLVVGEEEGLGKIGTGGINS